MGGASELLDLFFRGLLLDSSVGNSLAAVAFPFTAGPGSGRIRRCVLM